MSTVSRASFLSSLASLAADNSTGDISPADLRSLLTDLADSYFNALTDGGLGARETISDATLAGLASVGSPIYRTTGGAWALCKADAQGTAVAHAVVESISSPNVVIVYSGKITLSGLTTGYTYYVSPSTAGATTSTVPTGASQYKQPVFVAISSTVALVTLDLEPLALSLISASDVAPSTYNAQTGTTYTGVLTDAPGGISFNNASAITFTIPPNSSVAYSTGSEIPLLQLGAGQVTISPGSGVTLNSRGAAYKLAGQYAPAVLKKTATDTWILSGDITT